MCGYYSVVTFEQMSYEVCSLCQCCTPVRLAAGQRRQGAWSHGGVPAVEEQQAEWPGAGVAAATRRVGLGHRRPAGAGSPLAWSCQRVQLGRGRADVLSLSLSRRGAALLPSE
jgi:hypothetical protein